MIYKTMRTPITYYGGKQTMLKHILPLIPKHKLYTEAFCGGCAVFFAKRPVEAEVINDFNGDLVNFYMVARDNFDAWHFVDSPYVNSDCGHYEGVFGERNLDRLLDLLT